MRDKQQTNMKISAPKKEGKLNYAWSDQDLATLRKLVSEGRKTSEIAAILGVKPQRVQDKRINLGIGSRAFRGGIKRKCLVCDEEFKSRGAHNRLCATCRATNFWPW